MWASSPVPRTGVRGVSPRVLIPSVAAISGAISCPHHFHSSSASLPLVLSSQVGESPSSSRRDLSSGSGCPSVKSASSSGTPVSQYRRTTATPSAPPAGVRVVLRRPPRAPAGRVSAPGAARFGDQADRGLGVVEAFASPASSCSTTHAPCPGTPGSPSAKWSSTACSTPQPRRTCRPVPEPAAFLLLDYIADHDYMNTATNQAPLLAFPAAARSALPPRSPVRAQRDRCPSGCHPRPALRQQLLKTAAPVGVDALGHHDNTTTRQLREAGGT